MNPDVAVVKEVLLEALAGPDGEQAAYAEYAAIIKKHGEVAPYVFIQQAESRHIEALTRQFEKYGLDAPKNKYLGKIKSPVKLVDAAKQGIEAEEKNVAMYDRLLAKAKDYPDLTRVFTNLQRCSREMHLPAFKAAVEQNGQLDVSAASGRGSGCGQGCGMGCGRGRGAGQQRRAVEVIR